MQLDHIFDNLEIQTKPFALCEIHGACDVSLPPDAAVTVHYVLSGTGDIVMRERPHIPISAGTLVLIPALIRHELRNTGTQVSPGPACKPAELHLTRVLNAAPGGSDSRLLALCAHLDIGLAGTGNLVELIREPMAARVAPQDALHSCISGIMRELSSPGLGSRAMIRALLLQAVIELLRQRVSQGDGMLRWMAALRDPKLWQALQIMLDRPGDPHSVESLAAQSGMSRSAFARRFSEAYGSGPMELLRDLRMRKAATLLTRSELPVKRIAAQVGFSSRSAFSRQFEAKTGHSPRAFRNLR